MISPAGMERLAEHARAGLPIVVRASDMRRVCGSDTASDAEVAAAFDSILGLENVRRASSEKEVAAALEEPGVDRRVRFEVPRLEATMYQDAVDGTCYHYLHNNAYPENSGMMGDANKGEDKVLLDVTVTLAGSGVPYRFDPCTGQVAPIADYAAGDGCVTLTIDALPGGTAAIFAATEDTAVFDAVAGEPLDLSDDRWDLIIHSLGPRDGSGAPSDSLVTDVDFGAVTLGAWSDIEAGEKELSELGVSDMRHVSGTDDYTLSFATPAGWGDYDGAIVAVSYGRDQVGAVIVNGTELAANNASDRVDVGALIGEGVNTITIRPNTTLYARTYVEHDGYQNAGAPFGMGHGSGDLPDHDGSRNGLLSITLVPYVTATTDAIPDVL